MRAHDGGGFAGGVRSPGRRSGPSGGRRPGGMSEGGRLMGAPGKAFGRAMLEPSDGPWYGPVRQDVTRTRVVGQVRPVGLRRQPEGSFTPPPTEGPTALARSKVHGL